MNTYFFVFILPILWGSVSVVSYFHPGDEYGLYAISNIIGVWPLMILQVFSLSFDIHNLWIPTIVAITGSLIMASIGFGLDKLNVNQWLWGILWIMFSTLLFIYVLNVHPTIQKTLAKYGSWTAIIAYALNVGLYVSVILSAIVGTIVLIVKQTKNRKIQEQKQ